MYELIIAGGGPAGMTAAVYAARKRINALLISKDIGGQVLTTARVENYMGYQYIEGPELMQKFEEQVKQFPLEQKIGQGIVALSRSGGGFEVSTDKGETYQAKAVIVATGKRPRQLNVPGEKVAVIGGGNSALEAADDMIKIADYVYLVSLTPFTGDQILIDKVKTAPNLSIFLEHEVEEIKGTSRGRVSGLRV